MIQAALKGNKVFRRTLGAAFVTAGVGGGIYYVQADQGTRRAIKVSSSSTSERNDNISPFFFNPIFVRRIQRLSPLYCTIDLLKQSTEFSVKTRQNGTLLMTFMPPERSKNL